MGVQMIKRKYAILMIAEIVLFSGCEMDDRNYVSMEDEQQSDADQQDPNPDNNDPPSNETCTKNVCVDGTRVCSLDGDVMFCADFDGDGCTEWTIIPCDKLIGCENGYCKNESNGESGACSDQCKPDEYQCDEDDDGNVGLKKCDDYNGDGCVEWSGVVPCSNGQACIDDRCACTDVCSAGKTECVDSNALRTCVDLNFDGCYEWSENTLCDGVCIDGECQCVHACETNDAVCAENGYKLCTENQNGCRVWSAVVPCEQGCENGKCRSPETMKPTRYPGNTIHSPMTAYAVEKMKAIIANNPSQNNNRFIKVGDSHMYSGSVFMYCFSKTGSKGGMDLHGETELNDVINTFQSDAFDSFHRDSIAAVVGKTAYWANSGGFLNNEIQAIKPRFAFYGYGTNDMGWYGYTKPADGSAGYYKALEWYYQNISKGAKTMINNGVIPLFIGTGYRTDKPTVDNEGLLPIHWVKTFDAVARGVAENYQVPYYNLAYSQLPLAASGYGLGGDGIHHKKIGKGCDFTDNGLTGGANIRNHHAIQMLDRAWRTLIQGEKAPDKVIEFTGSGSFSDPWVIDALPYTHSGNTTNGYSKFVSYNCSSAKEEGPEIYYTLTLSKQTKIRAFALSNTSSVDVDIHLLNDLNESKCMTRGNIWVEATLSAGTYFFVVDTYKTTTAGEYLFAIVECDEDDAYCAATTTGG